MSLRQASTNDLGTQVQLTGHFTFHSGGWPILFFQDSSGGMLAPPIEPPIVEGRRVELTGIVGSDGSLTLPQCRFLEDSQSWPPAPAVSAVDFNTGVFDCLMVSLRGRLFSVEAERSHFRLGLLASDGQTLIASIPQDRVDSSQLTRWIDQTLLMTGVSGASVDSAGKVIGMRLWIPNVAKIQADDSDAVQEGPESIRTDSLLELRQTILEPLGPNLRIASGRMTLLDGPHTFFVQDPSGGIRVRTREPVDIPIGTGIRFAGHLRDDASFGRYLDDAIVRVDSSVPAEWGDPRLTTADRSDSEDMWHRLITLDGCLLQASEAGDRPYLSIACNDRVVFAALRWSPDQDLRRLLHPNTQVRVTGVLTPVRPVPHRSSALWMIVRAPEDLVVTGHVMRLDTRWALLLMAFGAGITGITCLLALAFRHQFRRKTTELISSEARLRTVITNAPVIIFSMDSRGVFTLSEGRGLAKLGLKPGEVVGQSAFDVYRDYPSICQNVRKALNGETGHEVVTVGAGVFEVFYNPMRGDDGAIVGLIGAATDITERERANRDLIAAHGRLVELSRQAGMAEIATAVLHNVGNALTSVNVSASLLAEQIFDGRNDRLTRLSALLREHETDLPAFLNHHPQGRLVPEYIAQLAEFHLSRDRELADELRSLLRNVEHIREIIARQQNYARVGGFLEQLSPLGLTQDALDMQAASLNSHGITVVHEFSEVAPALLDKHKVLQILTNLITNAKQSMATTPQGRARILTLAVSAKPPSSFQIRVRDTGLGIPRENLNAIFAYGFTTKDRGHGFGLHSAALYAQEMGGTLTAHSDGPDTGATFILELPLQPPSSADGPSDGDGHASSTTGRPSPHPG